MRKIGAPTFAAVAGLAGLAALAALAAVAGGVAHARVVAVRTSVYYPPHPVARAAVVGTAAVATAVAVGTVVHTLPPACTRTAVGSAVYEQCGSTWYQPRYAGSDVTYVVVAPPR